MHKVRVSKEGQVNTYALMWNASWSFLKTAEQEVEGSYYQIMASLIFTAFTMEAYLNHLGKQLLQCWNEIEISLSPSKKLRLLAEKIGIEIHERKRPFQTVFNIFKFRNWFAHGKTVYFKSEKDFYVLNKKLNKYKYHPPETKWMKYCRLQNALNAQEDVEKIIRLFQDKSGIKDHLLFDFGTWGGTSTPLPENDNS